MQWFLIELEGMQKVQIFTRKRELVALLLMSFGCLDTVYVL